MYEAPGVGLAAPQVGVQKRMFVYDSGDGLGPRTVVNPVISESAWRVDLRGGLPLGSRAVAGPSCAPRKSISPGTTSTATTISIEADEFLARVFQHEVDHLDGVLLVERLDEDQRKEAMRILRMRALGLPADDPQRLGALARNDRHTGHDTACPAPTSSPCPGWSTSVPPRPPLRRCGRSSLPGTRSSWW